MKFLIFLHTRYWLLLYSTSSDILGFTYYFLKIWECLKIILITYSNYLSNFLYESTLTCWFEQSHPHLTHVLCVAAVITNSAWSLPSCMPANQPDRVSPDAACLVPHISHILIPMMMLFHWPLSKLYSRTWKDGYLSIWLTVHTDNEGGPDLTL